MLLSKQCVGTGESSGCDFRYGVELWQRPCPPSSLQMGPSQVVCTNVVSAPYSYVNEFVIFPADHFLLGHS